MSAVATGYSPGFVTSKSGFDIEELFKEVQDPPAQAIGVLVTHNALRLAREVLGRAEAQTRYSALYLWIKEYRERLGGDYAVRVLPDEELLVVEEARFDVFFYDREQLSPTRWRGRSSVKWDHKASGWRPSGVCTAEVTKGVMG